MKRGDKIPCVFYFYFHSKLKEKAKEGIISVGEAKSYLFQWRIPKNLRPVILKELVALNLLQRDGKTWFKIKEGDLDLENISKLYSLINCN
jgi:hypothetical protein